MKKQFSKFFISISSIDWGVFVAFILLNLIFCLAYPYARLMISGSFRAEDWLMAMCILGIFIAFWAALLIRELVAWVVSIPIQFVAFSLALWLILGVPVGMSIRVIVPVLISQVPGVAAGLLIRRLIRKRHARIKTPKPWWAN